MKIRLPLCASSGEESWPENIIKYNITEEQLKKICSTSEAIREFKYFLNDCIDKNDETEKLDLFVKNKSL